ncbi:hypothetical protein RDWZM_005223 [Blomia tropicalis]|uniref:Uncharacterized protein n=1 Tax=Blomia tropicalis TaxID=40697 RepID=A0A9Q0RM65_BLOTA|nr:hypothetical protein RDWZM_005223 [Blomia tropicalis]
MQILKLFFVLLLVVAGAFGEFRRFCGDHGDCKHIDKDRPTECCIKGNLNGYHECLDNPNPNERCPPLPTFG